LRGLGVFAVCRECVTGRREADGDFSFSLQIVGGELWLGEDCRGQRP